MQTILLILCLAALATVTAVRFSAQRRESRLLRELAGRRRLNFSPEDLIDLHDRYYRLSIVRRGHSRFAWNLLYGSTEEGLVSLFCYRCNVGFGTGQTHQAWWVAVMETAQPHAAWQAEPQATADPIQSENYQEVLGSWALRAESPTTLDRLRSAGLQAVLDDHPSLEHAEVRRQLVCLAAPHHRGVETPERLLEAIRRLSRLVEKT